MSLSHAALPRRLRSPAGAPPAAAAAPAWGGVLRTAVRLLAVPAAILAFYVRWGVLMWLASPGRDAGAGARRWARMQRYRGARGSDAVMGQLDYWTIRIFRGASPFSLGGFLRAPFRALSFARETARFRGAAVQRDSGVPVLAQALDLWLLQLRLPATFLTEPQLYYDQRLHAPERRSGARYLFSMLQQNVLVTAVNRCRNLGKREFAATCEAAGLPHVPTIAEIEAGGAVRWTGARRALPPEDLFSKPETGEGGRGAMRWLYQPDGTYRAESGALLDEAAVLEALRSQAAGQAVLIQPRLRNHPDVEAQFGPTLTTIRYVTELLPDGRVEPVMAVHRSASADGPADNYGAGGIACAVDLETGALRRPTVVHTHGRLAAALPIRPDRHPYTGRRITGFRLPWWEETAALAARAHRAFSSYPCLGWDVALCPGGPVLVEANTRWSAHLLQVVHQQGLGRLPYAERLLARIAATPADEAARFLRRRGRGGNGPAAAV